MYSYDIKLDNDGNTLLENGDFRLTSDDTEFICQMLMTSPGGWKFHPALGVGLTEFIGAQATNNTIAEIRARINGFFKTFGLYPQILLYYINDSTLSAQLTFTLLGQLSTLDLSLFFDINSGIITFTNVTPVVQSVQNTMITNKYLQRRG